MLHPSRQHTTEFYPRWILIVLILVAFGLRLWKLNVLPPGLFFDEAFNGWDARRVAFEGYYPLYFPGNHGREPLFLYLLALSVRLFGPTAYALRLVSALVGVLAVPATYVAACLILKPLNIALREQSGSRFLTAFAPLIAAAGIAVSYWHLSLSRLAFRVILLPTLSALALALFWRAWRGRELRNYAWSAFLLAMTLYTYIAARFVPFVVGLFILVEFGIDLMRSKSNRTAWGKDWRRRLQGIGVMLAIGTLVLIPLIWVFWHDPALLSSRTSGISVFTATQSEMPGAPLQRLSYNLGAVAGSLYLSGDLNPQHNLPGRPVNDPLLALLFTVGLLTALYRIKQPWARLLLIWLAVMSLPTMLSTQAPHALRGAGMLPPLALLYGVGGFTLASELLRLRRPGMPFAGQRDRLRLTVVTVALLGGVVAVSGTWTAVDYFARWAQLGVLGREFHLSSQLAAQQVVNLLNARPDRPILVTRSLYEQPNMAYALGKAQPQSLTSEKLAELVPPGSSPPVVYDEDFDPRQAMYLLWKEGGSVRSAWLDPPVAAGEHASSVVAPPVHDGTRYSWPDAQPRWPQVIVGTLAATYELKPRHVRYPLNVSFANGVKLTGYDVWPDAIMSGLSDSAYRLALFWTLPNAVQTALATSESTTASPEQFHVFAQLSGRDGVWQTANGPIGGQFLLPWLEWTGTRGEEVRELPVPSNMTPGKAHFEVGLYRTDGSGKRVAIVDAQGQEIADRVDLGAVLLGNSLPEVNLSGLKSLGAKFEDRIELTGWQVTRDPTNQQRLLVDLGWRALDRSPADYTAFVHLLDESGQIIAQNDGPPGGAENPTGFWVPGETIRSRFPIELPRDATFDSATLRIGLYELASGKRLSLTASPGPSVAALADQFILLPVDLSAVQSQ